MALSPHSNGQDHSQEMVASRIHGKPSPLPNRGRHATRRDLHASYNVAKKVVEFEYQEEIPRSRLRAAYGDGFKGAPLRCQVSGEGAIPPDAGIYDGQATQALSISRQAASAIGGSHHV